MIHYGDISIPEEIPYVFFVGFVYSTPNKSNLSSKDISDIDESIATICPNLSNNFKKNISRSLFLETDVIEQVINWQEITGGRVTELFEKLARARRQLNPIKISEEIKFAFLLGISKWWDGDDEQFTKNRKLFLYSLSKTICRNVEQDRLLDIRGYFNRTPITFEIREKISQLANGRSEWNFDYYDETEPDTEEERMLRKFQEENK